MKGRLFGTFEVDLDPRTPKLGGSFNPRNVKNGVAHAYDPQLLRFVYGQLVGIRNAVLVDVGANTGSFCLLAKFLPTLRVVAFEPNPVVFEVLEENLKRNRISGRVLAWPYALAGRDYKRKLRLPKKGGMSGHATLGEKPCFEAGKTEAVDAFPLDAVFIRDHLDLLKVDTEGCELYVFQGAVETLRKFKPGIVYERNAKAAAQFGLKPDDATKFLRSLGYANFEKVGAEDVWATM